MNKAQIRDRTRQIAGAELDGLRSDAEMDLLIEESYRQVGHLVDWRWRDTVDTFETVEDVDEYDVPAEVEQIQGVTILDADGHTLPVPIRETTLRDILTRVRRDESEMPQFYAKTKGDRLKLAPIPDGDYTVEVFGLAHLEGLDEDTDEPEWDVRFHSIICYLAAAVFLAEEGQEELAASRRARAEELLADMVDHYQPSRDTGLIQLGGGGAGERLWPWR